jgi:hypothetical protein
LATVVQQSHPEVLHFIQLSFNTHYVRHFQTFLLAYRKMKFTNFNVLPFFYKKNKKMTLEKLADSRDELHNVASNVAY